MPRDFPRSRRIAEQIQRELSDILRLELKDPRIGMITVTGVDVSPDYTHAKIFFTLLGGDTEAARTAEVLNRACGFMRSQLAHRLRLRTVPQLQFKFDTSVERGLRLSRLIDDAVAADAHNAGDK